MRLLFRWLLRLVVLVLPGALPASAQGYDVVIARGRVIDPESGLDAERWVGIRNGRIAALSTQPLRGARTIEAKGLVVAPGFIDLHQHGQDDENYRIAALDGVTTALELEVGAADVERWYRDRAHGQLIKYGVAIGHIPVRMAVLGDSGSFLPSGPAANREATPAEVAEMVRRLEAGLQQGAVAVGFGTAYTPAATRWEILDMFRVAARYGASCHIHIRDGVVGVEEAIAASALTAAPLHIVHINSVSHSDIGRMLQLVVDVRAHGVDVTTEAYPYTAGMTQIESALFDGWEKQPDAHFPTLEWVATGERLSRATFAEHRRQGGMVISHSNTEENVAVAIASPLSMIRQRRFDPPRQRAPTLLGDVRQGARTLCAGDASAHAHGGNPENDAHACATT